MKQKWNKNYIRMGIVFTIAVCICITFNEVLKEWRSILATIGEILSAMTPIIIGIVIAFLINPIMIYVRKGITRFICKCIVKSDENYNKIYHKTKVAGLIITITAFLALIVGFMWLVIPKIYLSLQDLVTNMSGYLDNAQAWVEKMFSKNAKLEGQMSNIIDYVQDNLMDVLENRIMPNLDTIIVQISTGVIGGVKIVFNFIIGLIVAIYLLASKEILLAQGKKVIYCIFSKKTGNKIMRGCSYANSVFGGFINGKILDSTIIGIICFIFTAALEMKYAVLISVIIGVTNVIPFFGPFIGAVPGALLALMDAPIMFVIFVIFVIILQQVDGNIIGPLILGDSTGLSGVWVMIAILIGGDLFGVAGMILGVPVFACMYALFAVGLRDKLREKNLSSTTSDYFKLEGFDEETGEPIYRQKHDVRKSFKKRKRAGKKYKKQMAEKKAEEEDIKEKAEGAEAAEPEQNDNKMNNQSSTEKTEK